MAATKNEWVLRIPHAFGSDDHFEKVFSGDDAEHEAHALATALNNARQGSKALRIDGQIVFPDSLSNVMVREITDFDAVIAKAEADADARDEELRQARQREAEALQAKSDELKRQAEGTHEAAQGGADVRRAHESGATTDAEGAGAVRGAETSEAASESGASAADTTTEGG